MQSSNGNSNQNNQKRKKKNVSAKKEVAINEKKVENFLDDIVEQISFKQNSSGKLRYRRSSNKQSSNC